MQGKILDYNNEYKSSSIYDKDNYSVNAEIACKYGDCSLIKK